jgi:hypothetical protein
VQEREREQRRHSSSRSRSRSRAHSASPARQAAAGSAEKRSRKPKHIREDKQVRSRSQDLGVILQEPDGKVGACAAAAEDQQQERAGGKRQRSSSPVVDREGAERGAKDRCSQGRAAWLGFTIAFVCVGSARLSVLGPLKYSGRWGGGRRLAAGKVGLHACRVVVHACM